MELSRPILVGRMLVLQSHHGYHNHPRGKVYRCHKAKHRPGKAATSTTLAYFNLPGNLVIAPTIKTFSCGVPRFQSSKPNQKGRRDVVASSSALGSWSSVYYAVELVGSTVQKKLLNGVLGPLVSQGTRYLPKQPGKSHSLLMTEESDNAEHKQDVNKEQLEKLRHSVSDNTKPRSFPIVSSLKKGEPDQGYLHDDELGKKSVSYWVQMPSLQQYESAAAIVEKGLSSASRMLGRRRKLERVSSSSVTDNKEEFFKDEPSSVSQEPEATSELYTKSVSQIDMETTSGDPDQNVLKSTSTSSVNTPSSAASVLSKAPSLPMGAYSILKNFISPSSNAAVGSPSSGKKLENEDYSSSEPTIENNASLNPRHTTLEYKGSKSHTATSALPPDIAPTQNEMPNQSPPNDSVSYTYNNYNLKYIQVNLFKSPNTLLQLNKKEKVISVRNPPSNVDDGKAYFDSDIPLIEMTEALNNKDGAHVAGSGGSSRLVMADKKKRFAEVADKMKEEKDKLKAAEEKSVRKPTKQVISKANIDARTKSLAVGVALATNNASRLLTLERLCNHLVQYPESRHVAIQEKLIPTLLRLKRRSKDTTLLGQVHQALAQLGYASAVRGRGIRILAVDGGGSRGIIPIEMMRELERQSGQRIHEMFDYIIGVSSGAVLVYLLSYGKASLDTCEQLFKEISVEVFNRNSLLGTSKLVLNHAYYDTDAWMKILKIHMHGLGQMPAIETAQDPTCPKVASVATLMNGGAIKNFLFRNYNPPPNTTAFYQGSSKYQLCEGLRASSAAPGYFEEYKLDDYVFQDGGVLTNNPSALALHESRLLWPDTPIQCLVSLGTGRYDPMEEGLESPQYSSLRKKLYQIMISATDTEAVHTTLHDLLPEGAYFRFNPLITEDFLLDENRPEKIDQLQQEARDFAAYNELRIMQAAGVLTREKSKLQQAGDWVNDLRDTYHWKR